MKFGHFCLPTYYGDRDGTPGEFMRRFIDFLVSSEELGFDSLWANEHHFHPFGGIVPSPPILLAALAQRTSRVRLGTSIVVLPLHSPIEIAEQTAMVDLMSGGRVELGVGRGFVVHDYELFGLPFQEAQPRTLEGLEVLLKAWSGKPFTHAGKFHNFSDVEVWPRPQQRPHPPISMACSTNPASFEWTARQGYKLLTVAYIKPLQTLASLTRVYRQAWADAGRDPADCQVTTHYQVVLSDSRAEAQRTFSEALARYEQLEMNAVHASTARALQAAVEAKDHTPVDRLMAERRVIAGTPDDCVETLQYAQDLLGLTGVDCTFYFGGIDFAAAQRSHELFATEVIPRLRDAHPAPIGRSAASRPA